MSCDDLIRQIYPQLWYGDGYGYSRVGLVEQISASLNRQRRAGIPFEIAYSRACANLAASHETLVRRSDYELLADKEFQEIWRAGYLRLPHPGLDAAARLRPDGGYDNPLTVSTHHALTSDPSERRCISKE